MEHGTGRFGKLRATSVKVGIPLGKIVLTMRHFSLHLAEAPFSFPNRKFYFFEANQSSFVIWYTHKCLLGMSLCCSLLWNVLLCFDSVLDYLFIHNSYCRIQLINYFAVWEKLKVQKQSERWQPETEEEYEDSQGNVVNRKTYEDLKRQGLL